MLRPSGAFIGCGLADGLFEHPEETGAIRELFAGGIQSVLTSFSIIY
jgi:hypothetical protein